MRRRHRHHSSPVTTSSRVARISVDAEEVEEVDEEEDPALRRGDGEEKKHSGEQYYHPGKAEEVEDDEVTDSDHYGYEDDFEEDEDLTERGRSTDTGDDANKVDSNRRRSASSPKTRRATTAPAPSVSSSISTSRSAAVAAASTTATATVTATKGRSAGAATMRRIRKGEYSIGECIGSGSFSRVYEGLNTRTGELIAVKVMAIGGGMQNVQDLHAEVTLMSRLSHPNIVQYLGSDVDLDNGQICVLQEWVPGGALSAVVSRFGGSLPVSVIRKYSAQILAGLEYLHANGVVHRDIKGGNILVDDRGVCKLADFGASLDIADALDNGGGASTNMETSIVKGTPYFLAPEVLGSNRTGRRADIWAVGCTVYEMMAGQPPWQSEKPCSIVALFRMVSGMRVGRGGSRSRSRSDSGSESDGASDESDSVTGSGTARRDSLLPPFPEGKLRQCEDVLDEHTDLRSFMELCFQREVKNRPYAHELRKHAFVVSHAGGDDDWDAGVRPRTDRGHGGHVSGDGKKVDEDDDSVGGQKCRHGVGGDDHTRHARSHDDIAAVALAQERELDSLLLHSSQNSPLNSSNPMDDTIDDGHTDSADDVDAGVAAATDPSLFQRHDQSAMGQFLAELEGEYDKASDDGDVDDSAEGQARTSHDSGRSSQGHADARPRRQEPDTKWPTWTKSTRYEVQFVEKSQLRTVHDDDEDGEDNDDDCEQGLAVSGGVELHSRGNAACIPVERDREGDGDENEEEEGDPSAESSWTCRHCQELVDDESLAYCPFCARTRHSTGVRR